MKKLLTLIISTTFALGLLIPIASAQMKFDLNSIRLQQNGQKQGQKYLESERINPVTGEKMSPIIVFLLDTIETATLLIGSVAFLALIGAGIIMIVNIGNEQAVTRAKGIFLYSILGLVFAFASYFIVIFIQGLFVEI